MAAENLELASTTTYTVQMAHRRTEGIVASPIAGPVPQNASLVRLHAPMEMITVYWTAISEGKPPRLPSHKSFATNYNRVFLGGERVGITYPSVVGHVWIAAGRFDYVVVGPEGLESRFALAKCPWEGTTASDFYIDASNFQRSGIFNPLAIVPQGLSYDPDAILLNSELLGHS